MARTAAVNVVVRFPPEVHEALKIAAAGDDPPMSFNRLVVIACCSYLKKLEMPSPSRVRTASTLRAARTAAAQRAAASPIPAGRREVVTHWKGGKP